MRLTDVLNWLKLSPPELVENASTLERKVRQLCAVSEGIPYALGDDKEDNAKRPRLSTDLVLDVDSCVTNSSQWVEFLPAYVDALTDNSFQARALTAFTETVLMCIGHLTLTPSVFTDFHGDRKRGLEDHRLFLQHCQEHLGPLVQHIFDHQSFALQTLAESHGHVYGFSVFYLLATNKLFVPAALKFDNSAWLAVGRSLRLVIRQAPEGTPTRGLSARDVCASRSSKVSLDFGINADSIIYFLVALRTALQELSCDMRSNSRVAIDALLLFLGFMPDTETLIRAWITKKRSADYMLNMTLYQLKQVGSLLGVRAELVDKYLLSADSRGLLRPVLRTVGAERSDFDDMLYRLLGREGSPLMVKRLMSFANAASITNVCSKVFNNFDAKAWAAWIIALCYYPRRTSKIVRPFPMFSATPGSSQSSNVNEAEHQWAFDCSINDQILGAIAKQLQLQLRRSTRHSHSELLCLLFSAACCLPRNSVLWHHFAVNSLQDVVLSCVLSKCDTTEDKIEVFGETIGVVSAEDTSEVYSLLRAHLKLAEKEAASMLSLVPASGSSNDDMLFSLALFERMVDDIALVGGSVINLSKIDLSKLPDLVLVRFFEMSFKAAGDSKSSLLTTKICHGVLKKLTQYLVLVDRLENQDLNRVYVSGIGSMFDKIFSPVTTEATHVVGREEVYRRLAEYLLDPSNKLAVRTLTNALIVSYLGNRIVFGVSPTDDPLLNLILYFFAGGEEVVERSVKLYNYRHSEVAVDLFADITFSLLKDLLGLYCHHNHQLMKTLCPKILSLQYLQYDISIDIDQKKLCRHAAASVSVTKAPDNDISASDATAEAVQEKNAELTQNSAAPSADSEQKQCSCLEFREWYRECRKQVGSNSDLQNTVAMRLAELQNNTNERDLPVQCIDIHQEIFKMLCSTWSDMLKESTVQPALLVELLKWSPKILGRSFSERQVSISKAIGACFLGETVEFPIWGPSNQFDYLALLRERDLLRNKKSPAIAEQEPPSKETMVIPCWVVQNLRVVFGPWFTRWVGDYARADATTQQAQELDFQVYMDVLVMWLRTLYASVPLSTRPAEKLLMNAGEHCVAADRVLKMVYASGEPSAYPMLCEANESVRSRRRVLGWIYESGLLVTLTQLLAFPHLNVASVVGECFDIIEELVAMEIYREKVLNIIRKEPRMRLNRKVRHSLETLSTLHFVRKNVLSQESPRVLRCLSQIIHEALRGEQMFCELINSYVTVCVKPETARARVSSELRKLLWSQLRTHAMSITKIGEACAPVESGGDVCENRANFCFTSFLRARA